MWRLTFLIFISFSFNALADVNVYSAREERLIKPLLDQFTEESGIAVNLTTGGDDVLIKRIEIEGKRSAADLLLTVDVTRLSRAKAKGLLQSVHSAILDRSVPALYRDTTGHWFSLSVRARAIVYAKDRVRPDELSGYVDLALPKWRGRICVRSSSHPYNQSLVANLIAHLGEAETEEWAHGFVANMARHPKGGDRDQIRAVVTGLCDIALVNHYYLGNMLHSPRPSDVAVARAVEIFWPDQKGAGTHVNVSGAGVARYAPHREEAIKLLEFLVSDEAQSWYAAANYEYPVQIDIAPTPQLTKWGSFKRDAAHLRDLGGLNKAAVKLMDRAGWR